MDKNREVKNRIGIQMVDIERKQASKEIRGWKSKTALYKLLKQDKFIYVFKRSRVRNRFPLLKYFARLKQTLLHELEEGGIGALAFFPFPGGGRRFLGLPLRCILLSAHL